MLVLDETDTTPSSVQLDAWNRLWSLLLDNPAPAQPPQDSCDDTADDNADADASA